MLIAGSNGHIAWGFTNSYGDWTDIVVVEPDPQDPERYLTADGSEPFGIAHETLAIRGGEPAFSSCRARAGGRSSITTRPAGRSRSRGRRIDPRATNLRMLDFETATNVDEALQVANRAGGPVQNFLVADADGPHRLVADGPGAGARELRLDVAAFVARAGRRLDRLAHARGISAHRRSAVGPLVDRERAHDRCRNVARVSWATVVTTSARAPRRSATICSRCALRAPRT